MIIVTGGAGFIGSALIWRLNQEGIKDIVVVDQLGLQHKWKNLRKKQVRQFVHKDQFFQWMRGEKPDIEAIFHMGACSRTTENNADYLMENNVRYSMQLFRIATAAGIPFIYASSAATYGAMESGFSDHHAKIPNLIPINKYGFSKHFFDCWVLEQRDSPPIWAGLKFFNVYGPNEYHKESQASVAYHAFHQIRELGVIKLFKSYRPSVGHGGQARDFVYIKDVIDVMAHLFTQRKHIKSGIYNVGSGQARTFSALGEALFRALAIKESAFEWIDMPHAIRDQYQYFTEAHLDKLRTDGGYAKPFFSIEEGVKDYVCHHLQKDDPYL